MDVKRIKLQEGIHMPGAGENGKSFSDHQDQPQHAERDCRIIFDPTVPLVSILHKRTGERAIVPMSNIAAIYPGELPVTREQMIERCAQVAHETNRAYAAALGDTSHKPWAESPDWQRESARKGVVAALDHPELTPEQSHEGWLAEKRAAGWTCGRQKSAKAKTHPCMVAYSELPPEQRAKDVIFLSAVRLTAETMRIAENPLRPAMAPNASER